MREPTAGEQLGGVPYTNKTVVTKDDFFAYTQETGSLTQAGTNHLYGFNQTRTSAPVPIVKDTQGFVFFTRPMLNLSLSNLQRAASMFSLSNTTANSVQRFIRCTLDPYLMYKLQVGKDGGADCPMVDNKQAFIPLLSNTLITLSGWPDTVSPTYTSKEGLRKEQWSIVDGTNEVNGVFSMDANFLNVADQSVSGLLSKWAKYATLVFDGQMYPYAAMLRNNEVDYTTRIYRLVMDKSGRYVTKIACTIASYPINEPTSKYFDYDRSKNYSEANKNVNIRFQCTGARYDEDIIVRWFNTTTTYANPDLIKVMSAGFKPASSHTYEPIPPSIMNKFKHRGYPLINEDTFELEWWISRESASYKKVMSEYTKPEESLFNAIDKTTNGMVSQAFTNPYDINRK